jgi:predicted ArsR family transcriptional regulator
MLKKVDYMSKTLRTKKEILKLLSVRSKTLTDISTELELAPSTVSQHLVELKAIGAIENVENPHVKKWKYYRKAPQFSLDILKRVLKNNVNVGMSSMEIGAAF